MIPFIHLYPNGRRCLSEIERPEDIEAKARKFIANGGEYYCGIIAGGKAKVSAGIGEREGPSELVDNGPDILAAVDRVILASQVMLATESS